MAGHGGQHRLGLEAKPHTPNRTADSYMETARPFAPVRRRQGPSPVRFWVRERRRFTAWAGEYRDTRTGWLRRQSRANPSLAGNSLLTGKITGNIAEFGPIGVSVAGKTLVTAMP